MPYFLQNGDVNYSYFAPDCFHFSEKGQNAAGKALWNTMVGNQSCCYTLPLVASFNMNHLEKYNLRIFFNNKKHPLNGFLLHPLL